MYRVASKGQEAVRTTVSLPVDLMKRSQRFIDDGTLPNRNALLVAALERLTRELEQQAIDREFAAMAEDSEYREIQRAVVQEFDASDWEAWEQGEKANS